MKKEKLDKYLKIYTIFTDEIVLAPSFEKYEWDLNEDKEKRIEIEKKLRNELKNSKEETLLLNMEKIKKNDLKVNRTGRFHIFNQLDIFVITMEMLKIDETGRYEKAKDNNEVNRHLYNKKEDIEVIFYNSYIYPTDIKNEENKTAF